MIRALVLLTSALLIASTPASAFGEGDEIHVEAMVVAALQAVAQCNSIMPAEVETVDAGAELWEACVLENVASTACGNCMVCGAVQGCNFRITLGEDFELPSVVPDRYAPTKIKVTVPFPSFTTSGETVINGVGSLPVSAGHATLCFSGFPTC